MIQTGSSLLASKDLTLDQWNRVAMRDDDSNQETLLSYSKLVIHKLLLLKRKHFALLLLIGLTGSFGAVSSSEVVHLRQADAADPGEVGVAVASAR
jgi:hypothetical protein